MGRPQHLHTTVGRLAPTEDFGGEGWPGEDGQQAAWPGQPAQLEPTGKTQDPRWGPAGLDRTRAGASRELCSARDSEPALKKDAGEGQESWDGRGASQPKKEIDPTSDFLSQKRLGAIRDYQFESEGLRGLKTPRKNAATYSYLFSSVTHFSRQQHYHSPGGILARRQVLWHLVCSPRTDSSFW